MNRKIVKVIVALSVIYSEYIELGHDKEAKKILELIKVLREE